MSDDSDRLKLATKSTRYGIYGLLIGVYHFVFGFGEWVDDQNIYVKATISGIVFVAVAQIANVAGSAIFTTFWGQAVYMSGVRLRLIPIPLSLLIYILIFTFLLFVYSIDSSIQELQSEVDELRSELDEMKDNTDEIEK